MDDGPVIHSVPAASTCDGALKVSDACDRDERSWLDADQCPRPVLHMVSGSGRDLGVDVLATDLGGPLVAHVRRKRGVSLHSDLLVRSLSVRTERCFDANHEAHPRIGLGPSDVAAVRVARHHDRSAIANEPERRDVGISVVVDRCQPQRDGSRKQTLDLRYQEAARHNAIMPLVRTATTSRVQKARRSDGAAAP